ncbi:hypothetical protein B296_00010244 [Ensete ventricosum]|uniref:Uncharacterized protein n=1 Tax=Ensete ventricosum TaxID=4639 RepID=A0A427ANT1_ENSVE|nr:hypothetical protein B296_00010244 [Ensete ventricosum]
MKLLPNNGPRSSLGIGSGSDDAMGFRREFARRFAEGIGKLTGNTSGDHRKKTKRLTARIPNAAGLAGVNRPYPGIRATKPPRSTGKPSVLGFSRYDWILALILKPIWGL